MSACGCPTGLGYRFHRMPCSRAGEIEDLAPTTHRPEESPDE